MARPTAPEAREKILKLLAQHPEGMRNKDLAIAIYGEPKNDDQKRLNQTAISFCIRALAEAQRVYKDDGDLFTPWKLANGAVRPQVQVHDLPDATPGRGRPRGSKNGKNGTAPASLRAYIIRDIRAKLAELEALE